MTKGNDIMADIIESVKYALEIYRKMQDTDSSEVPKGGSIIDGDTILADIVENADMEVPGLSENLMEIYLKSNDKKSLEDMFECITGVTFEYYVDTCIESTRFV